MILFIFVNHNRDHTIVFWNQSFKKF